MSFNFVRHDLALMKTDAVVDADHSPLLAGSGFGGALRRTLSARITGLQQKDPAKSPCPAGQSVLVRGYGLPVRYIIRTTGPVWQGGGQGEEEQLASCYRTALELAEQAGCHSLAFPLISASLGYPRRAALRTARDVILEFLQAHELDVYLVVPRYLDIAIDEQTAQQLTPLLREYDELHNVHYSISVVPSESVESQPEAWEKDLDNELSHQGESFSMALLKLIDEKGYTDVEIYKRANMSRKLFSKIRSHADYRPKKKTALALAIALRLTEDETEMFLNKAGYSLSDGMRDDIIIKYFLKHRLYDIYLINEVLFHYGEDTL